MATKKRLLLLRFNGNEFEETKELGLPDAALALGWCGASVCLGFKRECAARFRRTHLLLIPNTSLFKFMPALFLAWRVAWTSHLNPKR